MLTERDSAWVDVQDDLHWLDDGQALHLDQRARRLAAPVRRLARRGARNGSSPRATFDVHPYSAFGSGLEAGVVARAGSTSSRRPTNPTQRYLYRGRLDGSGKAERVTPGGPAGVRTPTRSRPTAGGRSTRYSSFGTPPVVDLVTLPDHKVVRTLVDNAKLKAAVGALAADAGRVLPGRHRRRRELDGW